MKLKNKKTGEIIECVVIPVDSNGYPNEYQVFDEGKSLTELNEEWEDYQEEPKKQYYLDCDGRIFEHHTTEYIKNKMKEIGNYFETREEAEKAVEKLKAWHKLIDYWGTEVLGWEIRDMPTGGNWQTVNVKFNVKTKKEPMELLDIVFGDEE